MASVDGPAGAQSSCQQGRSSREWAGTFVSTVANNLVGAGCNCILGTAIVPQSGRTLRSAVQESNIGNVMTSTCSPSIRLCVRHVTIPRRCLACHRLSTQCKRRSPRVVRYYLGIMWPLSESPCVCQAVRPEATSWLPERVHSVESRVRACSGLRPLRRGLLFASHGCVSRQHGKWPSQSPGRGPVGIGRKQQRHTDACNVKRKPFVKTLERWL